MDTVERAKLAAESRWAATFDWQTAPIEACYKRLTKLRAEAEKGGLILQQRVSNERVTSAMCYNPDCRGAKDADGNYTPVVIDIAGGRFAGSRSRHNPETGQIETAYACSAACFLYLSSNFKHSPGAVIEKVIQPEVVINEAAVIKI